MIFKDKNEKPIIEFVSLVDGLELIEEIKPKPMGKFIPQWWKEMPTMPRFNGWQTAKACPSFTDWFSQGYVIPMWADTLLKYNKKEETWAVETSDQFVWEIHGDQQFVDFKKPSLYGIPGDFIFKAICPWKAITPKGHSVMQLPLFFHFNKEYSLIPGIIDTDIYHQINQQVVCHTDGQEIFIPKGEPFAHYVPFKRQKYGIDVRAKTEADRKTFAKNDAYMATKFIGEGAYRIERSKRSK